MNSLPTHLAFDARHELAEGPVWRDGHLWWVNILAGEMHRFNPVTGAHDSRRIGGQLGCAVPCADGRWMLAHNRGFALFHWNSVQMEPVSEPEAALPDNRFNDGKCDPAGRLWAGTMSKDAKLNAGSLYCLDSSGRVRRVLDKVTISNGLAWPADARTMFYCDSSTQRVDAFDFDSGSGAISGRRTVVEFPAAAGSPDGMTIDENDNLWLALWGGSAVVCLDGRTGNELARVSLPVSQPTSCAFGGANLDELFITSAWQGLSARQRAQEPHAGGIFRVRPGVCGRPAAEFQMSACSLNTVAMAQP